MRLWGQEQHLLPVSRTGYFQSHQLTGFLQRSLKLYDPVDPFFLLPSPVLHAAVESKKKHLCLWKESEGKKELRGVLFCKQASFRCLKSPFFLHACGWSLSPASSLSLPMDQFPGVMTIVKCLLQPEPAWREQNIIEPGKQQSTRRK